MNFCLLFWKVLLRNVEKILKLKEFKGAIYHLSYGAIGENIRRKVNILKHGPEKNEQTNKT